MRWGRRGGGSAGLACTSSCDHIQLVGGLATETAELLSPCGLSRGMAWVSYISSVPKWTRAKAARCLKIWRSHDVEVVAVFNLQRV